MPNVGAGDGAKRGSATPRNVFIASGAMLLGTLCVVPVWNALSLLQDANYVFWTGTRIPFFMIAMCAMVVVVYILTIMAFFGYSRPQVQTEQTILMIANVFITLLGLALMLVSLPLSRQSDVMYNNLMRRCDYSPQTHRVFEYSQVLQNIRQSPGCIDKFSVEECPGYEDAPPYTSFLKTIENDLHCSGFCYSPPAAAATAAPEAAAAPPAAGSLAAGSGAKAANASTPLTALLLKWGGQESAQGRPRREHEDRVLSFGLVQMAEQATGGVAAAQPDAFSEQSNSNSHYPPTLFSDANYQASCEGMSARDLRNFAGDVGAQTFYQGIYLVLIAIAASSLKLVGFCTRRDTDYPK